MMELENDKTIFKYLRPTENIVLSSINMNDIKDILVYLDRYYLEYRDILGIDDNITFGMEIEMEHFKGSVSDFWPFELEINRIVGNNDWVIKNDITLEWGRELATQIYTDKVKTWNDLKNVCEFSRKYGEIGIKCAGHINIGSQIFGNNSLYWKRFLKLWSIYENVIYRFGYGEFLTYFPFITYSAKPISKTVLNKIDLIDSYVDSFDVIHSLYEKGMNIDFLKKNAVSFFSMYEFDNYDFLQNGCRVEFRNFLGTLDSVIWQNNINFIIKLMLYCKSDDFNEDILNSRKKEIIGINGELFAYSKVYLEQAIELSDMIFNNNLDKIYFLRQYIKSFEMCNKSYVKAKKMTVTNYC